MTLNSSYPEHITVKESLYTFFKGNPLLQSFKIVEATINNDTGSNILIEKVSLLVNLLGGILSSNLLKTTNDQISLVFEYFHLQILSLILHGDWGKDLAIKTHVTVTLTRLIKAIEKRLPTVVESLQYLIKLLSNPWRNPTMVKILNEEKLVPEEELDLVRAEIGLVLVVRLKILTQAKCDDQALRLIDVCLRCVRNVKNKVHFQSHSNEIFQIQDLYMILLVRTKKLERTLDEVNRMGRLECLKMIQRCSNETILPNLQTSCVEMLNIVATSLLTTAMLEPITEESSLVEIIQQFCKIGPKAQLLSELLKRFLTIASSSQHMYLLIQVFADHFGEAGQFMCIEMYVRALTFNLNELEKHKTNNDFEGQDLSEHHLCKGFLLLADCFKKDVFMSRECVLTAFSILPSENCLSVLQSMAIETNNNEDNPEFCNLEKLPSNPTQTDSNLKDYINKILAYHIYIPDAEHLGITQNLWNDLATVIGNARFKELNWTLDWDQLRKRCENYMQENWVKFRNSKKELLYLNIDYDFK